MKKLNKKGFTLAELLIVVAIIAILIAIAIPVFTKQLEKSRDATTAANIRAAYSEAAVGLIDADEVFYYKGADDDYGKLYEYQNGAIPTDIATNAANYAKWYTCKVQSSDFTLDGFESSLPLEVPVGDPCVNPRATLIQFLLTDEDANGNDVAPYFIGWAFSDGELGTMIKEIGSDKFEGQFTAD